MRLNEISMIMFLATFFTIGCITQAEPQAAAPQEGLTAPQTEPLQESAVATLSPARDMTGSWSGSVNFDDYTEIPVCAYKGNIRLELRQEESKLEGTWQITINGKTPLTKTDRCVKELGAGLANALEGTISSTQFKFATDGFPELKFDGTFTTDLMQGNLEFCMPYGKCPGGTVGSKGTFSAIRT